MAVHPDIEGRHHPLEAQEGLASLPTVGQAERSAILSCRVTFYVGGPFFFRFPGNVWRVNLERISGRDINRCAVGTSAGVLPVGRYGKCSPATGVIVRSVEVLDALLGCLGPAELPLTIKALLSVAFLLAIGDKVGPCRLAIDLQYVVVLPVVMFLGNSLRELDG